jgi:hypothetical protein
MKPILKALACAAFLSAAVTATASAQTLHNSQWSTGSGPDKETAHDNAYASADSILRLACTVVNGALQNEREDSTSYLFFGRAGWQASITVEADCVTPDSSNGS